MRPEGVGDERMARSARRTGGGEADSHYREKNRLKDDDEWQNDVDEGEYRQRNIVYLG